MSIKDLIRTINKSQWRFFWLVVFLVIIITGAPFIYGWLLTPPETIFNGLHTVSSEDFVAYYSYIEQVKQGNWLFFDLFTPEKQKIGTFNIFWLAAGLIAKLFNFSSIFTLHLLRILLIPLLLFVLFVFIVYIFKDSLARKICFLILVFSSGIGAWAAIFLKPAFYIQHGQGYRWPIDLWVVHTNVFITISQSPHLILSLLLSILILFLALLSFENNNYKYSFWAGICGLILFQFHPYQLPTIFAILMIYVFISFLIKNSRLAWPYLKHLFLIFIISLPSLIYHFWLLSNDWVTRVRASQNITLLPPLTFIFLGYGFILIFALAGTYFVLKNKVSNKIIFILTWFVVSFVLILLPTQFQIRFLQGWIFPMAVLSTIFLIKVYSYFKAKFFKKINSGYWILISTLLFLLFLTPSDLFNIARD
ncbi:MAG: hypothetical protein ACTSQY_11725, partial [Candidatus Odinarchaeia archaeon]